MGHSDRLGIENRVAVVSEIGRLHAALSRVKAVEEEDGHLASDDLGLYLSFLAWAKSASALVVTPLAS